MLISSATIDCWLDVRGQSPAGQPYSDFQHHHWQVGPSTTIDGMLGNTLNYFWGLNVSGADGSGTWSTINQSKLFVNDAQAWKDPQNVVSLKQTKPFMTMGHDFQAIAIPSAQSHPVLRDDLARPDLGR